MLDIKNQNIAKTGTASFNINDPRQVKDLIMGMYADQDRLVTQINTNGIGIYDSGIVTCNPSGSTNVIGAVNTNVFDEYTGFGSSTGWAYDGINQPLIHIAAPGAYLSSFRSKKWTGINKVTVYTNLSAVSANVTFGLVSGATTSYYTIGTKTFIGSGGAGGAGNYGTTGNYYASLGNTINGTPMAAHALSTNIGDAGTCWGEIIYTNGVNAGSGDGRVGAWYEGQVANPNSPYQLVDSYYTSYIGFGIQTNYALTGFKFQFLIEYFN